MAIARRILICTNEDGVVVQPLPSKNQRSLQALVVKYGDGSISHIPRDKVPEHPGPSSSFEAFGVIGLMTVSRHSFLITITRREQVAQIRGFPVYVVTGVAITPCSSRAEAEKSIAKTVHHLREEQGDKVVQDESDPLSDDAEHLVRTSDEVEDVVDSAAASAGPGGPADPAVTSTVAEDVILKRGSFGRFAQRWFSKKGWVLDQRRTMGLSRSPLEEEASATAAETYPRSSEDGFEATASALLPKLLRTAQILFGSSRSFFFSYDFDITRRWGECRPFAPDAVPYAQVSPMYFWNSHLLQPFLAGGADHLALPVMQGFVGQKAFIADSDPPQVDETAPEAMEMSSLFLSGSGLMSQPDEPVKDTPERRPTERDFLITVISRRSTKRAGLRYLRRGLDEDGNTANSVETEQILSTPSWNSSPAKGGSRIYSFVQVRGSIPVYFTQSPFSFKPVPVIQHSDDANFLALKKHFDHLRQVYGSVQLVNLVEKRGTEAVVGDAYARHVERLNAENGSGAGADKVPFEWFDFHAVCRGMKFENVSRLLETIRGTLDSFGSTITATPDGGEEEEVLQKQRGVVRTNCMDCLDRTNVCQSLFAKYMLEAQLRAEGFDMTAQVDQNAWWFNNIWADNGDAISNQYASTAAMKGDYTRTRKRDYRGTLNDLGLSITRFYNGLVNDYFSQLAIDFLLGNVTALVFSEFEADMMTKDPGVSILKKREQAIQLCQERVVADESEEFIGGWAVLVPQGPSSGTIVRGGGQPLEEAVLLLTDAALYLCRYSWELDRVSSFERVDLAHVVGLKFGTYITSTVAPVHEDEAKNVGCVISYQPGKDDFTRTNTRTLSSLEDKRKTHRTSNNAGSGGSSAPGGFAGFFSGTKAKAGPVVKRIVLKAPYAQSSVARDGDGPRQTEIQQVVVMCSEIERMVRKARGRDAEEEEEDWGIIEKEDIVSLDEARRSAGLLEQLGHTIKRMVWA